MSTNWWEGYDWKPIDEVPGDFYAIRVRTDRPLDDDEASRFFGCLGYAFRKHMRGEPMDWPQRVGPDEWVAGYDSTKSFSDDWWQHIDDLIDDARLFVVEGSPPRKTKDNTRLVEGVGPISFDIWFA